MAFFAATRLLAHPLSRPITPIRPRAFTRPEFVQTSLGYHRSLPQKPATVRASGPIAETGSSSGLYSAQQFELTVKNVDLVLEDVRPYLIADGGNVDVISVEDGIISLKLQGACGSCPSSSTTMQMGIERVLKEKFGDAVKDIRQVDAEEVKETTVEAVNRHLDILRPAIKNFGGSVEVLSVEGADCLVNYSGPESIGSGIKAAIKEKFPDIVKGWEKQKSYGKLWEEDDDDDEEST